MKVFKIDSKIIISIHWSRSMKLTIRQHVFGKQCWYILNYPMVQWDISVTSGHKLRPVNLCRMYRWSWRGRVRCCRCCWRTPDVRILSVYVVADLKQLGKDDDFESISKKMRTSMVLLFLEGYFEDGLVRLLLIRNTRGLKIPIF